MDCRLLCIFIVTSHTCQEFLKSLFFHDGFIPVKKNIENTSRTSISISCEGMVTYHDLRVHYSTDFIMTALQKVFGVCWRFLVSGYLINKEIKVHCIYMGNGIFWNCCFIMPVHAVGKAGGIIHLLCQSFCHSSPQYLSGLFL